MILWKINTIITLIKMEKYFFLKIVKSFVFQCRKNSILMLQVQFCLFYCLPNPDSLFLNLFCFVTSTVVFIVVSCLTNQKSTRKQNTMPAQTFLCSHIDLRKQILIAWSPEATKGGMLYRFYSDHHSGYLMNMKKSSDLKENKSRSRERRDCSGISFVL